MKKLLAAAAALATVSTMAVAERYVMITHTQGTDPFWPVVEKGGRDAAAAIGAEFEYNFDPSGDMSGMAKLIEAAAASNPDGIIVSLPSSLNNIFLLFRFFSFIMLLIKRFYAKFLRYHTFY